MVPHLLSKFKTSMINLNEQNNNNDPLNLTGTRGNDPLNLLGGGNDPLNLIPRPTTPPNTTPAPPNTTPAPPNTTPAPITGGGTTPTTLTGDELKAGKFVKMGMKGDIIGKIPVIYGTDAII